MATFPGRWASKRTLAASNVPGRVNVSPTRAGYRRDVFLVWAEEQRKKADSFRETMRARAAHMRAVRAARRAAGPSFVTPDAEASLALGIAEAAVGALEAAAGEERS